MLSDYFTVVAGSIPVFLLAITLSSLGPRRGLVPNGNRFIKTVSDRSYGTFAVIGSGFGFLFALVGLMDVLNPCLQWVAAGLSGALAVVLAVVTSAEVLKLADAEDANAAVGAEGDASTPGPKDTTEPG